MEEFRRLIPDLVPLPGEPGFFIGTCGICEAVAGIVVGVKAFASSIPPRFNCVTCGLSGTLDDYQVLLAEGGQGEPEESVEAEEPTEVEEFVEPVEDPPVRKEGLGVYQGIPGLIQNEQGNYRGRCVFCGEDGFIAGGLKNAATGEETNDFLCLDCDRQGSPQEFLQALSEQSKLMEEENFKTSQPEPVDSQGLESEPSLDEEFLGEIGEEEGKTEVKGAEAVSNLRLPEEFLTLDLPGPELQCLILLWNHGPGLSISEILERTFLSRASVYRHLRELETKGLVLSKGSPKIYLKTETKKGVPYRTRSPQCTHRTPKAPNREPILNQKIRETLGNHRRRGTLAPKADIQQLQQHLRSLMIEAGHSEKTLAVMEGKQRRTWQFLRKDESKPFAEGNICYVNISGHKYPGKRTHSQGELLERIQQLEEALRQMKAKAL